MLNPQEKLRYGIKNWAEREREEQLRLVFAGLLGVAVLTTVAFTLVPFGSGAAYTEFYVLGDDGLAADYPSNLSVDESGLLQVGVGNHEHQPLTYTIVVRSGGETLWTEAVPLENGEERLTEVPISFESTGQKQVELDLYLGQQTDGKPYRNLRVSVSVR